MVEFRLYRKLKMSGKIYGNLTRYDANSIPDMISVIFLENKAQLQNNICRIYREGTIRTVSKAYQQNKQNCVINCAPEQITPIAGRTFTHCSLLFSVWRRGTTCGDSFLLVSAFYSRNCNYFNHDILRKNKDHIRIYLTFFSESFYRIWFTG